MRSCQYYFVNYLYTYIYKTGFYTKRFCKIFQMDLRTWGQRDKEKIWREKSKVSKEQLYWSYIKEYNFSLSIFRHQIMFLNSVFMAGFWKERKKHHWIVSQFNAQWSKENPKKINCSFFKHLTSLKSLTRAGLCVSWVEYIKASLCVWHRNTDV